MSTTIPSTTHAEHSEWQDYADLLAAAHEAHRPEIRELIHELPWNGIRCVLDAPCGDGFHIGLIAERLDADGEIIGVDIDNEALVSLERRKDILEGDVAVSSCRADVFALPFQAGRFDFVWCAQSLISLAEPRESLPSPGIEAALKEFHRVLRPGGMIALLEQDAMHYVLLPWPEELELALQRAQRQGFARMYGRPEQLIVGRHLGRMLAEGGFQVERRFSLTADRQAPLNQAETAFLKAYFEELRSRVEAHLNRDDRKEFDRLTNISSPDSFFHDPHFEMTCLEFVCLARKPPVDGFDFDHSRHR